MVESGPIKYEITSNGNLKMVGYRHPLSIKPEEFNFIRDTIVTHNLKSGFEVATAFGISALAAGIGMSFTLGKIVSMDSYIEEKYVDAGVYNGKDESIYEDAIGYKSAMYLRQFFELEDYIEFCVGWSPNDTKRIIEHHLSVPLDYVFIDSGHFTDQILADINAIVPYLNSNFIVFFHDVYEKSFTLSAVEEIEDLLHGNLEIVLPHPFGENLGMVCKGFKEN